MEQNGLIEWSGIRENANDRTGGGVDHESRNHVGPLVVKVEAEKKLALPDGAGGGQKNLLTESGTGESQRPERSARTAIAIAGQR